MFSDNGAKGQLIGPEGIEKLCADLDVDPSDVRVLIDKTLSLLVFAGYFRLLLPNFQLRCNLKTV